MKHHRNSTYHILESQHTLGAYSSSTHPVLLYFSHPARLFLLLLLCQIENAADVDFAGVKWSDLLAWYHSISTVLFLYLNLPPVIPILTCVYISCISTYPLSYLSSLVSTFLCTPTQVSRGELC